MKRTRVSMCNGRQYLEFEYDVHFAVAQYLEVKYDVHFSVVDGRCRLRVTDLPAHVQCFGFRAQGAGFRASGSRVRMISGFTVQSSEFGN